MIPYVLQYLVQELKPSQVPSKVSVSLLGEGGVWQEQQELEEVAREEGSSTSGAVVLSLHLAQEQEGRGARLSLQVDFKWLLLSEVVWQVEGVKEDIVEEGRVDVVKENSAKVEQEINKVEGKPGVERELVEVPEREFRQDVQQHSSKTEEVRKVVTENLNNHTYIHPSHRSEISLYATK